MIPIPAIDIRDGRCVRLLRGEFSAETEFGDPISQAMRFVEEGAPMLHIVDLDAARTGIPENDRVVREIVERSAVPVQFGGGVRDAVRAAELLDQGIARVVIGTLAVEDPETACALAERFPGRVVVGLDHNTYEESGRVTRIVAIRGWGESSKIDLDLALARLEDGPFGGAVITDISRDGTLLGPDIEGYSHSLSTTALPLIASGGVGTLEDLKMLRAIEISGHSLSGVIIGRALLSGAFNVSEAVIACAP